MNRNVERDSIETGGGVASGATSGSKNRSRTGRWLRLLRLQKADGGATPDTDLRPAPPDRLPADSPSLERALADDAVAFLERSSPVRFQIIVMGQPKLLKLELREQLHQIAREALGNAFLHARAAGIEVEISYSLRGLRVLVRDDGCGMDSKTVAARQRFGLRRMCERAMSIGAKVRIWSRPGSGTEVEIRAQALC
jgi:signal transduction histidine kinase